MWKSSLFFKYGGYVLHKFKKKKDPLTLFSLVKGTMINLGELKLWEILGIFATGPHIFAKTFFSLGWNKSKALAMLFGVRIDEVSKTKNYFFHQLSHPQNSCVGKDSSVQFFTSRRQLSYHKNGLFTVSICYAYTD